MSQERCDSPPITGEKNVPPVGELSVEMKKVLRAQERQASAQSKLEAMFATGEDISERDLKVVLRLLRRTLRK